MPPDDPMRSFWRERWSEGRIGFHQSDFNRHLVAHGRAVFGEPPRRVLVPLSGKSLDLLWLEAQGYEVVAAEYAERAVNEFHDENERPVEIGTALDLEVRRSGSITTFVADYFALTRDHVGPIHAIYDRAALVAIAPERRTEYVAHSLELLERGGTVLLLTIDYPQGEKEGPPYSVPDAVVRELYEPRRSVDCLHAEDVIDRHPAWREQGVRRLVERVYRLS
ncbi:MAG: thiopurine S-methyltransferase [Planctomycetes bacterium]|nr:thiopurine S-methyltransferase [Planctomycetota bacterium]